MEQYLVKRKKFRPQTLNILPHKFKPTYTEDDLIFLRAAVAGKWNSEDIFAHLRGVHPKTSERTFYRWLSQVLREK